MLRARAAPNRKYSRQPKQLMNWYRAYLHDAHFSLQPLLQRQSIPVFFIEFAVRPGGCFIFYPAIGVFWLTPVWVNLTSSAESCQQPGAFPELCSALQTLSAHLRRSEGVSKIPFSILVTQAYKGFPLLRMIL